MTTSSFKKADLIKWAIVFAGDSNNHADTCQ